MKLAVSLICSVLTVVSAATAQVELVSGNYFPAEFEFQELQKIKSEETIDDPARLSRIDGGRLFSDVGFRKYEKRIYSAGVSGSVSIEIVSLLDFRAAYSLLTLLREGSIKDGPPGDACTTMPGGIRFAQGKEWVRIQGNGVPEDLPRRIGLSVSNRIGSRHPKPPSLVAHLPKTGYDPSTLRYYPGIEAFKSYSGSVPEHLRHDLNFEIAQAHYSANSQTGTLSLLSFPTGEVAEEYFDGLGSTEPGSKSGRIYAKRAGPLVGMLDGTFDPGTAEKILNGIQFSYSIRWIETPAKPATVWGIPAGILGTVVKSLLFVVILCCVSILLGIGFAALRIALRVYAPQHSPDRPERTEITRLKMR